MLPIKNMAKVCYRRIARSHADRESLATGTAVRFVFANAASQEEATGTAIAPNATVSERDPGFRRHARIETLVGARRHRLQHRQRLLTRHVRAQRQNKAMK